MTFRKSNVGFKLNVNFKLTNIYITRHNKRIDKGYLAPIMEVVKIRIINEFKKDKKSQKNIYFSKNELSLILNEYSKNVAKGVWKDYAIDHNINCASFSIFRNSFERPVLKIEKRKFSFGFEYYLSKNDKPLFISKFISRVLGQIDKIPKLIKF